MPEQPGGEDVLREVEPLTSPGELLELLQQAVGRLAQEFVVRLPLVLMGVVVLVVGLVLTVVVARWVDRAFERSRAEHAAQRLVGNLLRAVLVLVVLLMALSVAGVQVGAVLAGLGLAGLALAFALQNILENFVAGILILIRRPFRRGDQIESHDFQGTVEDIDLRVTRLRDFDGELVLIPNAMVFTEPIVNLTRLGPRRTRVVVGVDYRDDHDAARQVLLEAVRATPGVLDSPPSEVLLTELADSSVDFEVAYWTAPQIREVRHVRDRVLSACKRSLEEAGMTIPWPIRTLAGEASLRVRPDGADGATRLAGWAAPRSRDPQSQRGPTETGPGSRREAHQVGVP